MGSCWGESCGVEVFTRVGSHLRDSMSNGIRKMHFCKLHLGVDGRMGARVREVPFSWLQS